jgi:hypothetical protein
MNPENKALENIDDQSEEQAQLISYRTMRILMRLSGDRPAFDPPFGKRLNAACIARKPRLVSAVHQRFPRYTNAGLVYGDTLRSRFFFS